MATTSQREKDLDRAIDRCGIPLEQFANTESCVREVMRRIGATESEHDYVKSRVAVRVKTAAALGRADALIGSTEKMLDQFDQDDKEWERKGKALGFKFWDK